MSTTFDQEPTPIRRSTPPPKKGGISWQHFIAIILLTIGVLYVTITNPIQFPLGKPAVSVVTNQATPTPDYSSLEKRADAFIPPKPSGIHADFYTSYDTMYLAVLDKLSPSKAKAVGVIHPYVDIEIACLSVNPFEGYSEENSDLYYIYADGGLQGWVWAADTWGHYKYSDGSRADPNDIPKCKF